MALCLCLLFTCLRVMATDPAGGLFLSVKREKGTDEWGILATRSSEELSGVEVAFGFSLTVKGGSICRVQAADGAESMTLTVGAPDREGTVRILLDGILPPAGKGDPVCLVRVETTSKAALRIETEGEYVYYRTAFETVEKRPLLSDQEAETEANIPPGEDASNEIPTEEDTIAPPKPTVPEITLPPETVEEPPAIAPNETAPPVFPRYLGCQETPVQDGTYAVRFLFDEADGALVPSVTVTVIGGGGSLTVKNERLSPDEVAKMTDGTQKRTWIGCTVSGLFSAGTYVFQIMTSGGPVEIVYCGGELVSQKSIAPIREGWVRAFCYR